MNDTQEAKLTMYLAVKDFLAVPANAAIVTPLPSFNAYLSSFITNTDQIQAIRTTQEDDRTGVAKTKQQLRTDMTMLAIDVARKITALATVTNNTILLAEVNYSQSDFINAPDTIARDKALLIQQKSVANLVALAPYGITAAINTALLTSINTFNASIATPQTGINTRKASTDKLKELFAANDKLLKEKMDVLVSTLRISNADFYKSYTQSRKINNDHPSRKIAFKGNVKDKNTTLAIAKATVSILSADYNKKNTKKTTAKGNFQWKTLAPGTYNVKFLKNGYNPVQKTVNINAGETTKIVVELEAV